MANPIHPKLEIPTQIAELIISSAAVIAKNSTKAAFRLGSGKASGGRTLRPGKETPLWNALRAELKTELKGFGKQVNLARLLGVPRQSIHAFITRGDRMPDAERTLQLIAWLAAVRSGSHPA